MLSCHSFFLFFFFLGGGGGDLKLVVRSTIIALSDFPKVEIIDSLILKKKTTSPT